METRTISRGVCVLLLAAGTLVTGCASRGPAVPQPFPTPGYRPPPRTPGDDGTPPNAGAAGPRTPLPPPSVLVQGLLSTAMHLIGTPYRNGGHDPDGFDCSGFVHYVFARQGLLVPRTVAEQASAGSIVGDIRAGDLVFFRTSGRRASHVGIALGPDEFVHAPSSRGEVRVEPLARRYWADRFLEARRIF